MKKGLLALSPLVVFITLYVVTSIIAGDFYKVPITVAFVASSIYAIITTRGKLRSRINLFSRGAGTPEMMLMIWIFILAGAFANSAKVMGCIDATVNLTLSLLPSEMLLAGLFLAACFISLSIGTSVGTIVALTPIAAGVATQTGASTAMLTAVVVGGSFFGDNLSFISDTTIIATQTQGCQPSDKFKVNAFIVVPAAIVILLVYILIGQNITAPTSIPDVEFWKVVPYLIVLITAIFGLNVMIVLALGIVLTGFIGLFNGSFDIYGWFQAMGDGILGMSELIIITLLAGGLLEIIKHNGGIDFIIDKLTRHIHSKRGGELSIAALVSLVNCCTANNTVAIITVGGIARKIGLKYELDPRKCASLLDTFSCFTQGIIPYGAQMLMAAGLASLNPIAILPHLYYPFAIGVAALTAIVLRYPRRYS
ncbi:Na+/H+ antiporter NhaC family protein [Xylanibacter brevis]|uniref:Na+/H+ antiporter NhaC family protein n=1 Tax=Xylanibacter brevis TaxID=83231 RepID=UPI000486B164|nr:Na+/H+ antiporter NhaC family protein [Xylanibacter brevis]